MAHNTYTSAIKRKAASLRKQGNSLKQISERLSIPKSTIRTWVEDVELSKELRNSLYTPKIEAMKNAVNSSHNRRVAEIALVKQEAEKEYKNSKNLTYLVAGALLYWAEGDKTKGTSFTNSDPRMISFMVRWLIEICKVRINNLEARLHIHNIDQEKTAIDYWSRITGIPKSNFKKSYVKEKGTGHRRNSLPNGIIRVRVCGTGNTDLRYKVLQWADIYSAKHIRP